jgi:hypothetical protein
MFKYKSDAELEAMSAAERDTYAKEKREHEATQNKEAIKNAVDTAKSEIVKDFDEKLKVATDAVADAKKANEDLEEIVKKQGEELAKKQTSGPEGNGMEVAKNVKTQLEALHKSTNAGVVSERVAIKVLSIKKMLETPRMMIDLKNEIKVHWNLFQCAGVL